MYSQPAHHGQTLGVGKVVVRRLSRGQRSEGEEDSRIDRRLEVVDAKEEGIGCDGRHSRPEAVRILHAAAEAVGNCRNRLAEEEERCSRNQAAGNGRHNLHSRPEERRILVEEEQSCSLPAHHSRRRRRRYSLVVEGSCCCVRNHHRRRDGRRRGSLGQGIRTWLGCIDRPIGEADSRRRGQ